MLTYRPDIDGLRALAVLPVVLYHAGFATFSGGYVGVDIFFVISGYLITSLIYSEINDGSFRFRNFYLRRIRRLFPALFTVVLLTCIPAYWLLLPEELEDFGQSVASLALFASNLLFFSESGYFAGAAEMKPLLHTWSLAIEEQYYLLFPVLLLLIKRTPGKPYFAVVGLLFAASLTYSAVAVYTAPEAAFYLLPSRTWELLLGSIIAMTGISISRAWLRESLAVFGLLLLGFAILTFTPEMPFPGLAALAPCLGTALLIVTGREQATRTARVLSDPRLVFFGLISYSLYLWHWPILVFAKHYFVAPLSLTVTWILIAISVLAAYLSWRFVERPFRGQQGILGSRRIFQATGATIALLIAVGLLFDSQEGLPGRLDPGISKILAVADDKPKRRKLCEGIAPGEVSMERLCPVAENDIPPSFLVWGDSHANMLIAGIAAQAQARGINGRFAVANGCVPLLGVRRVVQTTDVDCAEFNEAAINLLRDNPQIDTVIIAARWGLHAEGVPFAPDSGRAFWLQDAMQAADDPAGNRAIFQRAFDRTLSRLAELGRNVVILGPVPEVVADVPGALAKARWREQALNLDVRTADFLARQRGFFTAVQSLDADTRHRVIPLHERLCNDATCRLTNGDLPLYFDDNHLASAGLSMIAPALDSIFTAPPAAP